MAVTKARNPLRRLPLAVALAALAAITLFASAASAADPPGDNGTIKVDRLPFDDHPDNEPHVGCTFQVDFYGFDEGALFADVTFEAHPPTGPDQTLLTDTVFIGQDSNDGGGSVAGLDASETYTLDLSGIEPHPNQGVHVKLTIHADGSQGADTKYKVFWVTGCESGSTTSTTSSSSSSSSSTTSTTLGGGGSSTTTSTTLGGGGGSTTTTTTGGGGGSTTSTALGQLPATTTGGGGLPLTGGNALPLLLAALALLGAGAGAVVATRRRQADQPEPAE
jgi:hypothetical protein